MTAEQGCEGRDEFTNVSPRELWVWGTEVGWGEGVTVFAEEGGRFERLSRGSEAKLSAVQPGFSQCLFALCCNT